MSDTKPCPMCGEPMTLSVNDKDHDGNRLPPACTCESVRSYGNRRNGWLVCTQCGGDIGRNPSGIVFKRAETPSDSEREASRRGVMPAPDSAGRKTGASDCGSPMPQQPRRAPVTESTTLGGGADQSGSVPAAISDFLTPLEDLPADAVINRVSAMPHIERVSLVAARSPNDKYVSDIGWTAYVTMRYGEGTKTFESVRETSPGRAAQNALALYTEGGEGHWEWETDGVLDSERDDEAD